MEDYKPNSHRFNEEQKQKAVEEKRVEKVVKGTTRTKKKSEISKIKDTFISEDAVNVKSYIIMDVLIPAAKKAISDIVSNGVDMILYAGKNPDRNRRGGNSSYVSYRDYSRRDDDRRYSSSNTRKSDFEDVVFDYRSDAEEVLNQMHDIIDRYGFCTVTDLYDMADRTPPYTANRYGWTSVQSADVTRLSGGGYIIRLPRAMPID